jgi:predicted MFS family arabinose efflux permease
LSRFLMGVISTCISAASTTLLGEHIYIDKRPRVFGIQMAGGSAAGYVAMNAAGMIDDAFGWRQAFILYPLIAALTFIPAMLWIPRATRVVRVKTARIADGIRSRFEPLRATGQVLMSMWPLYFALLLMHATAYTNNSQTPFVLSEDGAESAAERARLIGYGHIMIMIAALSYPVTRRILGSRWIPAFFLTLMTSGLLLLGLTHDLTLAVVALLLLGFGNGTLFPHQSSLVVGRAPSAMRGRAVGLMVSNQFLADTINPFIFPPMIAVMGLHYAIATIGLFAGVGVIAALIYGSRTANIETPVGVLGH